jgi:hypothetical protein
MDKSKENLKLSMQIAGKATAIDNIKVEPTNDKINIRATISTLNIKGWEKRLINNAANFLNRDINNELSFSEDSILVPYIIAGNPYKKGAYIYIDMMYDIIRKYSVAKPLIPNYEVM